MTFWQGMGLLLNSYEGGVSVLWAMTAKMGEHWPRNIALDSVSTGAALQAAVLTGFLKRLKKEVFMGADYLVSVQL